MHAVVETIYMHRRSAGAMRARRGQRARYGCGIHGFQSTWYLLCIRAFCLDRKRTYQL